MLQVEMREPIKILLRFNCPNQLQNWKGIVLSVIASNIVVISDTCLDNAGVGNPLRHLLNGPVVEVRRTELFCYGIRKQLFEMIDLPILQF